MMLGNSTARTFAGIAAAALQNDNANSGIAKIIGSIIDVVSEETACLAANLPFDVAATNCRKARLLHEFNLAARAIESFDKDQDVTRDLRHMSMALQQNARQCKAHAAAVREIVGFAFEAVSEHESDGTYRRQTFNDF